jgi:imidazolonepropionase-like amidohydrolase
MSRAFMAALTGVLGLASVESAAAPPTAKKEVRTRPASPTPKASSVRPGTVFLVGAELHVGDGTVVKRSVVELRNDRIVKVGGEELAKTIPTDAEVIDLSGKMMTPGLIAADSNLGLVEIGLERSTRDDSRDDSSVIRAGYDPSSAINAASSLIPVQAVEGITSAAVAPNGGLLSGQVTWIDLVAGDHVGIVSAPRVAIDGTFGQSVSNSRAAAFTALRRTLDDARFYRRNRAGFDRGQSRPLAAHPLDLEALFPVLDGKIPLTLTAHRAGDILTLLELADDLGLKLVIVGGAEAWKVAGRLAKAKVPVVLQPTSNLPGNYDQMGARLDNAALLTAAGVEVVIADFGDAHNVRNVTQEAGVAVAYGMAWEEALSAITLNVARAYGLEKRYGSVAAGKVANLVVWEDDPFELANWPTQVWIRGARIPMTTRQTELRDRYRDLSQFRP